MLVTPPFGASSNIALWRAYSKPPVELVVADLEKNGLSQVYWYDDKYFYTLDGMVDLKELVKMAESIIKE